MINNPHCPSMHPVLVVSSGRAVREPPLRYRQIWVRCVVKPPMHSSVITVGGNGHHGGYSVVVTPSIASFQSPHGEETRFADLHLPHQDVSDRLLEILCPIPKNLIQPIKDYLLHQAQIIDLAVSICTVGGNEDAKGFRASESVVKLASLHHLCF